MNKAFIGLALILTLLAGCQSVKQERPPFIENHTYVNTDKFPHVSIHLFAPTIKDTLIDGQTYKVMVNDEGKTFIFRDNHLIFIHNDLPSAFDFIDFNEDGYLDILFTYASAQNEAYELLLFNPSRRDFIQIPDFNIQGGYPVKIKGTQYYYSYRPRGCADTCWGSDLFYFDHLY